MKKLFSSTLLLLGCMGISLLAHAEFPNDKEVTFVIPYSPGGGFDTIVRQFAPVVEADLGTSVVPKNIKGASGTRGGQAVSRADADGYTIGIYNIPGLTVSQVMDREIGFDLASVSWIANLASSQYAIAVKSDSPVQSLKDLCALGRDVKLSDTGKNSTSSITAAIAFNIMECPIVNVTGYGGSNDTMIAVMRGEVDATLKPVSSLNKYVKSGDLRFIATLSDKPLVDGVPSTTELGYPQLAKFGLNRVVGGPADLPADVVAKLESAFKSAIESDTITEWADGARVTLNWISAEDTTAMMKDLSEFYLQYKEILMSQ